MKRLFFFAVFLFSALALYAQKENDFHKHEIRASFGPSLITNAWILSGTVHYNLSAAYYYRPLEWFWVGGNFIAIVGDKINYQWREYSFDGSFSDFSKSKRKYCAIFAPEMRFSFVNTKELILYGALSGGIGKENGYDDKRAKYPRTLNYIQVTILGFTGNFGPKKNIFLGCELGIGFKGLASAHGGYRF